MKFSHRDQLLGFVAASEYITVNEVLCKSLQVFNIYERSDAFLESRVGGRTAYVDQMDYVEWLCQERCVEKVEPSKKNKLHARRYRNYPVMPTSQEIFATVGRLSKMLDEVELTRFTPMDVFILTVVDDCNVPWILHGGTGIGHSVRSDAEHLKHLIRRCGSFLRGIEEQWRHIYEEKVLNKKSIEQA